MGTEDTSTLNFHGHPALSQISFPWPSFTYSKMSVRYSKMCVEANDIPKSSNWFTDLSSWLTLAGFVFLPGTFTSVSESQKVAETEVGRDVQKAVVNIPLLPLAGICCLLGSSGTIWMWWKWRDNYIWLTKRIFTRVTLSFLQSYR